MAHGPVMKKNAEGSMTFATGLTPSETLTKPGPNGFGEDFSPRTVPLMVPVRAVVEVHVGVVKVREPVAGNWPSDCGVSD